LIFIDNDRHDALRTFPHVGTEWQQTEYLGTESPVKNPVVGSCLVPLPGRVGHPFLLGSNAL
jgi:hypothetical protein